MCHSSFYKCLRLDHKRLHHIHLCPMFTSQDNAVNEDDVGPLIPPPQGFRGPSARPPGGRPLSQSVPQVSNNVVFFLFTLHKKLWILI